MTRFVNAAAAAAALLAAAPAAAQVSNALARQAGIPAGLALPVPGAAVAEDPAGVGANPAAAGFAGGLNLEWFREGGVTRESQSDGLYAAAPLGPFGVGYSVEWVRPGDPELRRYRKNTLALSLGDHESISAGVAWSTFWSPDPAVAGFGSWDAGLTWRPSRHLSLAAAMLGRDAWLGDVKVPLTWDLGAATRFLDDTFTLSADLLADDRRRDDFHATHLAFGAAADLRAGWALAAQLLVPLRDVPGLSRDPSYVLALSWNAAHAGITGGAAATPARSGWLFGVRSSAERYRSAERPRQVPILNVARELEPGRVPFLDLGDPDPYGTLLLRLAALAGDPEVGAVVLRIGDLSVGAGRVEELRAALARVRERKPVLAYLTGGGTKEYWLATAATAIAAPPGNTLEITGIATSTLYLKDALARLGVSFEVVAAGAYKSAPEPLVRTGPSPAAREATDALLDDVFGRFVADVAEARRLAAERVRDLVNEGLFASEDAKAAGLVDEVLWPDELEGWAARLAGRRLRLERRYEPEAERIAQRWGSAPAIEIVRLEGTITGGRSRRGVADVAGAETVAAQLRRAAADRSVKAIVLRIDSPGGDGLASDLIWREVVRARERKPVIASMGDYAASGGYLAAVGADTIVAEPSTLTGSIGVFMVKPDLSGLLAKLSLQRAGYARGDTAEISSLGHPWTDKERAAVKKQIDGFYRLFVSRVAEGRKLTREQVEAVAGGRVWTGRRAQERGLVDRLGTLEDAIALAQQRAGLAPGEAGLRRASGGDEGGLLGGGGPLGAAAADRAVARALSAVPELRALSLLSEMGPVIAMPVEWVGAAAP